MNYYNDNEPFVCAWLRALVDNGLIPPGEIDERSITEVQPQDLLGFTQCHFFAGIAGWSRALQLAGWPDDRPVWTGSCPCQPISCSGHQKADADERHLWPAFYRLIRECRPPTVFGEQVAGSLGREWLAGIRADLEGVGYACGAADLCAAGVGAPHRRQRIYWLADSAVQGLEERALEQNHSGEELTTTERAGFWTDSNWRRCRDGKRRRIPIEPALFPLAARIPGRLGILRASGNAIVPQIAAAFVRACVFERKNKT